MIKPSLLNQFVREGGTTPERLLKGKKNSGLGAGLKKPIQVPIMSLPSPANDIVTTLETPPPYMILTDNQ